VKSYPSRTFALILCVLFFTFASHAAENVDNPQDKVLTDDFSRKFDLYWVDRNFIIHRNDQELPTTKTENYSRDTLFADGNYVESTYRLSTVGGNAFGLSFRGNQYDSYDSKFLIDEDALYYTRCLKERFDAARNKNGCNVFALFQNDQEIDRVEYHDLLGLNPFNLNFTKVGQLFYAKQVDEKTVLTLVFNRKAKKSIPFKSELFDPGQPNDLLGILPNGNIVYQTSSSSNDAYYQNVKLFQLDLLSNKSDLIIDLGKSLTGGNEGMVIGSHYYFRTGSGGKSLLKDDFQVARQNSKTHGQINDASKVACNLDSIIHTYFTKMICIHPSGAIVRIDSASAEEGDRLGAGDNPDNQPELFVGQRPMNLSSIRYLLAGANKAEKTLQQISVAFDTDGRIEYFLFWMHSSAPWKDGIYISSYSEVAGLGIPILLKDDAQLFGALPLKH